MHAATILLVLCAQTAFFAGCGSKVRLPTYAPTVERIRLTHHTGGAHHRVLVHEGRWIQAFGCSLQVVDPTSLAVIHDLPLGEFGRCGPVVDLAIVGERLWAVIEDDAVIECSLAGGEPPKIVRSLGAESLRVRPRTLSVVDGAAFASGVGGVVDLSTGERIYVSQDACGRVARVKEGLAVCSGRRVCLIEDGRYVGAASDLVNVRASAGANAGAGSELSLAFLLQSPENALAGLMTADVREVAGEDATIAAEGSAVKMRIMADELFLISPKRIDGFRIGDHALERACSIQITGAMDIARLDQRTFAIVGSAGRGRYELNADGESGAFVAAEREAGRLTYATGDGLMVIAGSAEGAWAYTVNSHAELTRETLEGSPPGPRSASTVHARATISDDGRVLTVIPAGDTGEAAPWEYREQNDAVLRTIIAVGGDFWLGHDRGVTILRARAATVDRNPEQKSRRTSQPADFGADPVVARFRIPGPVRFLFPLLAGKGAAYVSEFGGFGVIRVLDEVQ